MKQETIANVFSSGALIGFISDIQPLLTALVAITAVIINVRILMKQEKNKNVNKDR